MPRPTLLVAWLVAGLSLVVYLSSEMMHTGDSPPNVYTALSLLEEGNWLISPKETPLLFRWRLKTSKGESEVFIPESDLQVSQWIDEKVIELIGPYPHLVATSKQGEYSSTFGPGTGVLATPMFWFARLIAGDLRERADLLWWTGRLVGACCIAGSVACMYLMVRERTNLSIAVVVSLLYAFGTSVWSTSSQGLWQHSTNTLLQSLAILAFTRPSSSRESPLWCGVLISIGAWCRPTSAIYAVVFFISYLRADWDKARRFVVGSLPLAVCLATFNYQMFGSPFRFAQSQMGSLSLEKTGQLGVFQTPLIEGAAGLLFSPSRGLFIHTPFLLFAAAGAWMVLARNRFPEFKPLLVATLGVWLLEFKHFDWWGGWSFGCRHLVDTMFVLSLTVAVILPYVWSRPPWVALFALLAIWSVGIQWLAIRYYDASSWNARRVYEVVDTQGRCTRFWERADAESRGHEIREISLDIDSPENHDRLWSWSDSQIGYLFAHAAESQQRRRQANVMFLTPKSQKLAELHRQLAQKFIDAGDWSRAEEALQGIRHHGANADELSRRILQEKQSQGNP